MRRNLEIVRTADGGIALKARIQHGPGDLHTLSLSKDDLRALRRDAVALHQAFHRDEVRENDARKV